MATDEIARMTLSAGL